jgi:hypothetical protein
MLSRWATCCVVMSLMLALPLAGCSNGGHFPHAVRNLPADLKRSQSSGIYDDGWLKKEATVKLAGGSAAQLKLQALVPSVPGETQRLQLFTNGQRIAVRDVTPGELDLRAPVPASKSPREVVLRWAFAPRISRQDSRSAAALLRFIGIGPQARAPTSITAPADIAAQELFIKSGVYTDGWLAKRSSLVLAGGKAAQLTIRALVPSPKGQHLVVLVDGQPLFSQAVPGGDLQLGATVPASASTRKVELQFARTIRLRPPDKRRAAALLRFIGVSPAPTVIRGPADLKDQAPFTSGVYADGWLAKRSSLVLAGGKAAQLTIRVLVPSPNGQHLVVLVNGTRLVSQAVRGGKLKLGAALPASASTRRIELLFARTIRLRPPDKRRAAALLRSIRISPAD